MPDPRDKRAEIPFSGRLMTADPSVIGQNFQTLKNLRYTDTHVKGISGMAKVVTSIINAAYMKVRSAFHYLKAQPFESHILVQAYNTALTASAVFQNTTAIPNTGSCASAALWTDSSGAGLGRFSNAPNGQVIYCNGVDTCIWGGEGTMVGALVTTQAAMTSASATPTNPMIYTDEVNNTKQTAAEAFLCGSSYKTFLIGSSRPVQGATIYILTANTSANTLTVSESTAGSWTELSVTSDTTRVAGVSFAQTGKVSWASTVSTTKPRYIEGTNAYWYQFTIDAGSAIIYHITLDLPFQPIIDTWDGVYRDISRFYEIKTTFTDFSTAVLKQDYDSTSASTYYDASALPAYSAPNNMLILQFGEKITALNIIIPNSAMNTTANTVMAIDYWNGSDWSNITSVVDGTAISNISLWQTGVVYWNGSATAEYKRSYNNGPPLYTYRMRFDKNLSATVRIDYIAGISSPKSMSHYKFPVFAQGRVLLCCDMSGEKNKGIVSSKYMPQVYNGEDSVDIYWGDEGELTCGTELFSQYGSSLYSLILMFKDFETWVTAGQDITQWENNTFLLSSSIGCPAPMTLKTINLRAEPGAGINRALAIWQGANGIYMSDGRAPIPVHGDIEAYFDPQDSRCIDKSMIGNSCSSVDEVNQVYVWKFASGASTSLNKELGYDIKRNKWFEVERPTPLQCVLGVHDADGNSYLYGFTDDGYMYRLNYGTSFDSAPITHTVQFGDMPLGGLGIETRIRSIRLFEVAKTAALSSAICTHYADGKTTGTEMILSPVRSGYRIAQPQEDVKLDADSFHSLKIEMTTSNETVGLEPVALVVTHHSTHQD